MSLRLDADPNVNVILFSRDSAPSISGWIWRQHGDSGLSRSTGMDSRTSLPCESMTASGFKCSGAVSETITTDGATVSLRPTGAAISCDWTPEFVKWGGTGQVVSVGCSYARNDASLMTEQMSLACQAFNSDTFVELVCNGTSMVNGLDALLGKAPKPQPQPLPPAPVQLTPVTTSAAGPQPSTDPGSTQVTTTRSSVIEVDHQPPTEPAASTDPAASTPDRSASPDSQSTIVSSPDGSTSSPSTLSTTLRRFFSTTNTDQSTVLSGNSVGLNMSSTFSGTSRLIKTAGSTSSGKASLPVIIGIAAGIAALVIFIATVIMCYVQRRSRNTRHAVGSNHADQRFKTRAVGFRTFAPQYERHEISLDGTDHNCNLKVAFQTGQRPESSLSALEDQDEESSYEETEADHNLSNQRQQDDWAVKLAALKLRDRTRLDEVKRAQPLRINIGIPAMGDDLPSYDRRETGLGGLDMKKGRDEKQRKQ